MASAQDNHVNVKLLVLQIRQQAIFVIFVDQEWKLLIFKAEKGVLTSSCISSQHAVAHDDEHTWISAQTVIEGLVIEVLLLDRDLLLGHLHRLHNGLEHDIWLDDLALR